MLEYLIAPYSVKNFLRQNWTRQAVHIPASDRHKFAHLFSWEQLNHLLNFHQLDDSKLFFSLDGQALTEGSRRDWHSHFRQGATLVINGIDENIPALASLAKELCHEIGHPVQTNLYCSPAQQRGFSSHYDSHDVMILQIEGEKEWFIFPDTFKFPTSETRSPDHLPPDQPPYLQCVMRQGDCLYIPRGHWHYAIAGEIPSLHLTIGINCFVGMNWLQWLSSELQNQPIWRQNLPLSLDGNEQDREHHLKELQQSLIEYLQQPDLIQKYLSNLQTEIQPVAPFSLPAQLGFNIFDQGLETEFILLKSQRIEIAIITTEDSQEECYQVTVGSKQITITGLPLSVIKKLFQQSSFSILDMADWSPDLDLELEVIPLLTHLVTEGILLVKS
ncbi:MAG: transcription factor jumonji jmjC domain-containing protein [Pseudanabaena sp.]|nr:MAG: transcription factor jumonji jmjC domain-containing protein [Pseudanabaena sp.]